RFFAVAGRLVHDCQASRSSLFPELDVNHCNRSIRLGNRVKHLQRGQSKLPERARLHYTQILGLLRQETVDFVGGVGDVLTNSGILFKELRQPLSGSCVPTDVEALHGDSNERRWSRTSCVEYQGPLDLRAS